MEAEPKIDPSWTRETTIRRDAHGRWYHDGEAIETEAIERAFDRWLDRADDGRYILKNEINWAYCEIEGAPVFVRRAQVEADQLRLELSDGRVEVLEPDTLRQGLDGALYCQVRAGRLSAVFEREAAMALFDLIAEDGEGLLIELRGRQYRPKTVARPLEWPVPGE